MKRILITILVLVIPGALTVIAYGVLQPPGISADVIGLQSVTSGSGYARAEQPRELVFPQDHGPHPEYQTEWWYYTGNLAAIDGRHFGYQLTFFRRAVAPTQPARESDWATNQIYFAHFAITDVSRNSHWEVERFSRGAAGLAGAQAIPYRVWLENWSVELPLATSLQPAQSVLSPSQHPDGSRVRLRADDANHAIDLTLTADKPPVVHGNLGLSPKSDAPGNASYYYSFTRMTSEGKITIDGETFTVKGSSWMDHEFGTTELGANAVGWDWFSIQLADGRELMVFDIRNKDGTIDPVSSGTLVEADGTARHLPQADMKIDVLGTRRSSQSGANYPARWNVSVPSANLELTLVPHVADQEMRVSIIYWEGAVTVTGRSNGALVQGNGFVEMTGYAPQGKLP